MNELSREAKRLLADARAAENRRELTLDERAEIRRRFENARRGRRGYFARMLRAAAATVAAIAIVNGAAWAAPAVWITVLGAGVVTARMLAPKITGPSVQVLAPAAPQDLSIPRSEGETLPFAPAGESLSPEPVDEAPAGAIQAAPPMPSARHTLAKPRVREEPTDSRAERREGALRDEIDLLRAAQQAIRDRDEGRALRLIDEYERRFPDGALLVEASAARVIATCELVDRVRGLELAFEFGQRWPDAPIRARIATACAAAPPIAAGGATDPK